MRQRLQPTACLGLYSCGHQKVMGDDVLRKQPGWRQSACGKAVRQGIVSLDFLVKLEERPGSGTAAEGHSHRRTPCKAVLENAVTTQASRYKRLQARCLQLRAALSLCACMMMLEG